MASDIRARVAARLRRVDGLVESPSMFGPDDAFWCNGKEIAHFHGAEVVELRVTKAVIRELRPMLRADDRVTLRKGASDWIEPRIAPKPESSRSRVPPAPSSNGCH